MLDSVSDDAFARYVKQTGMATPAQIEDARKQAPLPLAEALVKMGVITALQRETVEKKLEAQREGVGELAGCRLLKKIGEGGMGAVYLAEDGARKRKVAIKILPKKHASDAAFLQRFRREAEAATTLDHPNIVQAYSAGEDRGYHFYVMEYCEGESLRKRIERLKFLPAADASQLVLQISQGLRHAHDQGFIHRDIKPDNVIVTPAGVVKILDFGLAKNLEDTNASFRTVTGAALGTPHYISPEQARGDKNVDGRTDIYSLGATYYHLITGQVPFQGSSIFEIIQKHLMEQLADPRDVRPEIPEGVVQVVRRMLAKAPADRHAGCAELIRDLERILAKQPPLTQPLDAALSSVAMPRVAAAARPRASRTPMLLGGAAAAALLVGIVAYAVWPSTPAVAQPPPKKAAPPVIAKKDPPKPVEPEPQAEVEKPKEAPKPEPARVEPEKPAPEPEKPKPEPEKPKEEPKPEPPKPPTEPEKPKEEPKPEPPKPTKGPVPDAAKLTAAGKTLRERYKEDYARKTGSDALATARKLLALDAPEDAAQNYARLLDARDFAAAGSDPQLALSAVERLAESFVVDALLLKTDGLVACNARTTTDGVTAIATAAFAHFDDCVQADRYDLALRLVKKAKEVSDPLKNDEMKAAAAARDKQVTLLNKEFQSVAAYARTLGEKPDDVPANAQMGRFYCLVKEDWGRGLPLLAKGDPPYKGLAEKELANPAESAVQKDLCEGWLALAEKETKGVRKDNLTERTRHWFDQVESKLLPADRARILKKLEALEKAAAPKTTAPKPVAPKAPAPDYANRLDLLTRVAPDHMSRTRGNWQVQAGALVSSLEGDNTRPTLVHLPVFFQEEYDLVVEAQRLSGSEDLVFALASRTNEFAMGLDGWRGESAGLNGPNGGFAWQRAGRGRIFADGKPHTIRFEVRRTGAVMRVDEEPIVTLTDYSRSSIPQTMTEGRQPPGAVSIATVRSSYRITKVTYMPLRTR
jgi:serine/threonine-protein kinase